MKKCELCNTLCSIFCESDQARLCWDCDSRVHRANFLVAKHKRVLLCHFCQSPTAWTGSGSKLTRIVTRCLSCENGGTRSGSGSDEKRGDEDDEEIQVVPWGESSSSSNGLSQSSDSSSESDGNRKKNRAFTSRKHGFC